jgi:hypothetical protein
MYFLNPNSLMAESILKEKSEKLFSQSVFDVIIWTIINFLLLITLTLKLDFVLVKIFISLIPETHKDRKILFYFLDILYLYSISLLVFNDFFAIHRINFHQICYDIIDLFTYMRKSVSFAVELRSVRGIIYVLLQFRRFNLKLKAVLNSIYLKF